MLQKFSLKYFVERKAIMLIVGCALAVIWLVIGVVSSLDIMENTMDKIYNEKQTLENRVTLLEDIIEQSVDSEQNLEEYENGTAVIHVYKAASKEKSYKSWNVYSSMKFQIKSLFMFMSLAFLVGVCIFASVFGYVYRSELKDSEECRKENKLIHTEKTESNDES